MKKRKPPVLLATVLVLMLVAVGIIYAPQGSGGGEQGGAQAANTPPPPAAEKGERPKIDPKQVASMAKGAMATTDPASAPKRPGMEGAPTGPSVAAFKPVQTKPMPNDSSTSTQWYTDQTAKK